MTLGAVFLAALAGSMHCGAMCGPFAAACGARPGPGVGYHLARLLVYVALGATAGALGAGVDHLAARLLGLQQLAGILMGLLLIVLAVRTLRPGRRDLVQIGDGRRPGLLGRLLRRGGARGAIGVGLLSGLLPCGWLWGFVALSASRGSATAGALVMGAFWAGTVPLLLVVGGVAGRITERARRWARPAVAAGLLGAGVLALAGHWLPTLDAGQAAVGAAARCHAP